jgi:outer membrane biosynthesis protein TonB
MGCERRRDDEALSDHLLGMRALLDAGGYLGPPGLAMRIAALCAEDGAREELQGRMEAAIALERFVMVGGGLAPGPAQPRELVAEVETHLRALLRDVLCGYLDADLAAVADDILLESSPDPPGEITARDLRSEGPEREPEPEPEDEPEAEAEPEAELEPEPEPEPDTAEPEPDTAELEAVAVQSPLEGVTASTDWGTDDPEDYSAPV